MVLACTSCFLWHQMTEQLDQLGGVLARGDPPMAEAVEGSGVEVLQRSSPRVLSTAVDHRVHGLWRTSRRCAFRLRASTCG